MTIGEIRVTPDVIEAIGLLVEKRETAMRNVLDDGMHRVGADLLISGDARAQGLRDALNLRQIVAEPGGEP